MKTSLRRWRDHREWFSALIHLTHGQVLALLIGAVLGVVVSVPAFLAVDAIKREAQERDSLNGFVTLLQRHEYEMAYKWWWLGDNIEPSETYPYDEAVQSLIDYLAYTRMDTNQRMELLAILRGFEQYSEPRYSRYAQQWLPGGRGVHTFMLLLDNLQRKADFLPYERTLQVSSTMREITLCGRLYGFYSLQPIRFNVSHDDCPVDAHAAIYHPATSEVTWLSEAGDVMDRTPLHD